MKIEVSAANGWTSPSGVVALSSSRSDVVPIATIRPPADGVTPSDETMPLTPETAIGAYKRSKVVAERVVEEMVARDRTLLGDAPALARTNRLFHRQIHGAARNRFLQSTLETMRLSLVLLPGATTLAAPDRAAESLTEHAAIVAAIRAHDADGAEAAARAHIRAAFKARIRIWQES